MDIDEIIKKSIDLHVHVSPEIIPRKFNLDELKKYERGKIRGIGAKNHFFPVVESFISNKKEPIIFNSITLNNYVGGFNADAVNALADISSNPIIVWFPTINAENFKNKNDLEIPKEWLGNKPGRKIALRKSSEIKGLSVVNSRGRLKKEVMEVLKIIKKRKAILATGHISWKESKKLIQYAVKEMGINKIIITHPIYQRINMPIEVQKELSQLGAFIEQCYSMYSIDKITINKIVKQIKEIGAEKCILTSDVGQTFSLNPSEALKKFAVLLKKEGITNEEIKEMLIKNPNFLIQNN